MEQQYKDINGEWHVSKWEEGTYHVTHEDGHTYTKYYGVNGFGHYNCPCLKKEAKQAKL